MVELRLKGLLEKRAVVSPLATLVTAAGSYCGDETYYSLCCRLVCHRTRPEHEANGWADSERFLRVKSCIIWGQDASTTTGSIWHSMTLNRPADGGRLPEGKMPLGMPSNEVGRNRSPVPHGDLD